MRYRKKTETVTAFQWLGHCEATKDIVHPFPVPGSDVILGWIGSPTFGEMVNVGDWVVVNDLGAQMAITDEEFTSTYEPVASQPRKGPERDWHRVACLMGQRVRTPDGVGLLIGAETPAFASVSWELALWLVWFGEGDAEGGAWSQKRYLSQDINEVVP